MTANLRLIQQGICDGYETSLIELYRLFYDRLHHFSLSIVRSAEDAEEIVEDIFVKIWANRKQVLSIGNLPVYLYVAAKNRCYDLLVQRGRSVHYSYEDMEDDMASPSLDPHKLLVSAEMMKRMQAAVEDLPSRGKMIFRLVREDGLHYNEVAQILNVPVNTVDVLMAIATKRVAYSLEPQVVNMKFIPGSSNRKK